MACIQKKSEAYSSQKGSALIYILVAIALLAALTASFMRPSSQQTSAQSGFKAVSELIIPDCIYPFIHSGVRFEVPLGGPWCFWNCWPFGDAEHAVSD